MKIKAGYILREVAGNNIVIPVGEERTQFNGVMTLTGSGAFLWKKIESGVSGEDELVAAILSEYEIDEATAKADVHNFVQAATDKGLLE